MSRDTDTQGGDRRDRQAAPSSSSLDPLAYFASSEELAQPDGRSDRAPNGVTGVRWGRRSDDLNRRRAGDSGHRGFDDSMERRAEDLRALPGDRYMPGELAGQTTGVISARRGDSRAESRSALQAGIDPSTSRMETQALTTYSRLLRLVLDETHDAILVFDPAGEVILSNRAFDNLLGPLALRRHGHQNLAECLEALGAMVDADTLEMLLAPHFMPRVRLQLEDGGELECGLSPLWLETPGDHRLMVFRDAVASGAELSDLRHRAFHDRLTGLPNRELLLDRLEQGLTRLGRDGGAVAVIFIDLDGFKLVNDQHGHAVGDRVLIEVARRLMREMRQVDTVGRLGGDEFVIVCDGVAETRSVGLICSRILRSLSSPIDVDGHTLTIGASIGAVVERASGTDPADLLHRADEHMYRAKREGTHINVAAGPADHGDRSVLARGLRTALEHGDLELVYLPLVGFGHNHVVAVEALLRCSSPTLSGVGARELIELAQESGALQQLTGWILSEAASAVAVLGASIDADLTVLVNLSGGQLGDPALGNLLSTAAADAGIEPRLIGLEIPESVMVTRSEELERQLDVLVALGCQLFADDITGRAVAVEHLNELGFSGIKLDGSVIVASHESSRANAAARALVDRAHQLHLSVVGQDISDETTLRTARQLGCNGAQGYGFFGLPRTLDQLLELID